MLKKWIKLSLLWLGLIALVLFHYVTGITPLILNAETFNYYVDYTYYDVANFDEYTPILTDKTPNLDLYFKVDFTTDYSATYCPINGTLGSIELILDVYTETIEQIGFYVSSVTPLYCIAPYETYSYSKLINLREVSFISGWTFEMVKEKILLLDDQYLLFGTSFLFRPNYQAYGYNITFDDPILRTAIQINFNNNYLMSTFLLDSDFLNTSKPGIHRPYVLYTETSKNTYNVYNDNLSTSIESRTKYAIEIPGLDAAIVVNKIGTGWETKYTDFTHTMTSSNLQVYNLWRIHTLNAAPMKTPFDNVAIDTTPNYSVCDYVLGFPIDCTLDGVPIGSFQAMANDLWEWTIKESPIFSDVWTLASGGFQWLSNTFQFLGYFDVDSLLGGILALLIGVIVMLWAWVGG